MQGPANTFPIFNSIECKGLNKVIECKEWKDCKKCKALATYSGSVIVLNAKVGTNSLNVKKGKKCMALPTNPTFFLYQMNATNA